MSTLTLSWALWLAATGAGLGLVTWAWLVMDRVEADLREFAGFDDLSHTSNFNQGLT